MKLINWIYNPVYKSIECDKNSKCLFQDHILETKELPIFRRAKLQQYLSNLELTPLDHTHTMTIHTGFVDVKLTKSEKKRNSGYEFQYDGFTFKIKPQDNVINQKLMRGVREISRRKFIYVYGSLTLQDALLYFTPYTVITKPTRIDPVSLKILAIKDLDLNYDDTTPDKSSDNIIMKDEQEEAKRKNLKILGGLLGKE